MAGKRKNGGAKGKGNRNVSRATPIGPRMRDGRFLSRAPRPAKKGGYGEYMRLAGQAIGAASGLPMGGLVGRMAGMGLSKITGHGDYTISKNTIATATVVGDVVPMFKVVGHNTQICHRELIGNVVSTGNGFDNTMFRVNAGNALCFPWLSEIAKRFQKYRFDGLVFVFKSSSSDYSAAAGMGTVVMASNYNTGDINYQDKQQMENSAFAVSCKPSLSLVHPIECARSDRAREWYFVRDGVNTVAAPQDFDMVLFQLAKSGLSAPAGQAIGELWVTYDVTLTESCQPPVAVTYDVRGTTYSYGSYNSASTTPNAGPLDNNTTQGQIQNSNLVLRAGQGVPSLLAYTAGTATLNTYANSIMIQPVPTTTKSDTSGSNKIWFARNGVYRLSLQWGVTSSAMTTNTWGFTGSGASCASVIGFTTSSTNGNQLLIITVVGVDPLTPNVELPYINFTGASAITHSTSAWDFSILE